MPVREVVGAGVRIPDDARFVENEGVVGDGKSADIGRGDARQVLGAALRHTDGLLVTVQLVDLDRAGFNQRKIAVVAVAVDDVEFGVFPVGADLLDRLRRGPFDQTADKRRVEVVADIRLIRQAHRRGLLRNAADEVVDRAVHKRHRRHFLS